MFFLLADSHDSGRGLLVYRPSGAYSYQLSENRQTLGSEHESGHTHLYMVEFGSPSQLLINTGFNQLPTQTDAAVIDESHTVKVLMLSRASRRAARK